VTAAVSGAGVLGHSGDVSSRLREAVESSERRCSEGAGEDERVLAAVKENALLIAAEMRASEPVLRELVEGGKLLVKAALYDIESGEVSVLEDGRGL
jgi:carbonic anhydrase